MLIPGVGYDVSSDYRREKMFQHTVVERQLHDLLDDISLLRSTERQPSSQTVEGHPQSAASQVTENHVLRVAAQKSMLSACMLRCCISSSAHLQHLLPLQSLVGSHFV